MKKTIGKGLTETKLVLGKSMDEIDNESYGAGLGPMDSKATTISLRAGSAKHPDGAPARRMGQLPAKIAEEQATVVPSPL